MPARNILPFKSIVADDGMHSVHARYCTPILCMCAQSVLMLSNGSTLEHTAHAIRGCNIIATACMHSMIGNCCLLLAGGASSRAAHNNNSSASYHTSCFCQWLWCHRMGAYVILTRFLPPCVRCALLVLYHNSGPRRILHPQNACIQ